MPSYLAFNLRVQSDVDLPGLLTAKREAYPVIHVKQERIPSERLHDLNDDGDFLTGVAADLMRFRVERGEVITFDPEPGADMDYIRALLTGELLAALLRQRGILTLHGSCVAGEDGAVGFVGFSGWGKSTTATYFTSRGYSLLADDIIGVDLTGEGAVVVPAFPQVKLKPDAGAHLIEGYERLPQAHTETSKRLYNHRAAFSDRPTPLRRLYILEGEVSDTNEIQQLSGQHAFLELVRHTRVTQLIKSAAHVRRHTEACAALVRTVPVSLLRRRRSLSDLPEIFRLVQEDLRTAEVQHLI